MDAEQYTWTDLGSSAGYSKQLNSKRRIRLKNPTKYFDSSKDRTFVAFGSPDSYQSRQIKIEGYETRLYYEFLWSQQNNGQTFFYTLTYNDKNVPKYMGHNCFDYEHLRHLLNGGFKKYLLRNFGTNFRYFVGAELGDGKGVRGLHNNPHYHILFFLRDAKDERYSYKRISPYFFRHLIRMYWQGFDQDFGWKSYKNALFGIVKEGEDIGLVSDFRAVAYVSKYVTKDVQLVRFEKSLFYRLGQKYRTLYKDTTQSYFDFFKERLNSIFNIPTNVAKTEWLYDYKQLYKILAVRCTFHMPSVLFDSDEWMSFREDIIKSTISYYNLWNDYYQFVDLKAKVLVDDDIREYRNRYCNKCRISQHVGEYALHFVGDYNNPIVPIPSKSGIKYRPVCLYLYRKLYTDVYTDLDGSTFRILNPRGINYKVSKIEKDVEKLSSKIHSLVSSIDESLFISMILSDVNESVSLSFGHFKLLLSEALKYNTLSNICKRYAEFKLVYEDRYFKAGLEEDGRTPSFPNLHLSSDYARFLWTSVGHVKRGNHRLDLFLENPPLGYLPYFSHPYFLQYSCLFSVFDLLTDYFFVQGDDKAQAEAERIAETKRFHNSLKFLSTYGKD